MPADNGGDGLPYWSDPDGCPDGNLQGRWGNGAMCTGRLVEHGYRFDY